MKNTKAARAIQRRNPGRVAGLRTLGKNRKFLFEKLFQDYDPVTVGRVRRHAISLDDETVSINHCAIERSGNGEYTLIDIGATNGVYVAEFGAYSHEIKVSECVLKMGMHIRLGDIVLTPVDKRAEAPVIVKRITELFQRLLNLYGSYHETANHLKPSRQTVRRTLERKRKKEAAIEKWARQKKAAGKRKRKVDQS